MESYEFAIKMELDGERYYKEQAKKHKDSGLAVVFLTLAGDERKHAQVLRDRMGDLIPELSDTLSYDEYKNVFKEASDFHSIIKEDIDQLDVYSLAMDKEKSSIDLYKKMLKEAQTDEDLKMFEFLIKEEETHYRILEEIWTHVSRIQEWVESAEFGLREEY